MIFILHLKNKLFLVRIDCPQIGGIRVRIFPLRADITTDLKSKKILFGKKTMTEEKNQLYL